MADPVRFGPASTFGVTAEDTTDFYRRHWERPIALSLPGFYRWQFVDTPEAGGRDFSSVAVSDGGLMGIMGCTPRGFLLDGRRCRGGEITTWVVQAEARGKGLGRGIIADLQARYDVLIAFGIGQAAIPVFVTSGFSYIAALPRFTRVLDLDALRPIAEIEALGERLAARHTPFTARYSAAPTDPAEGAAITAPLADRTNMFARDEAYLRWRFVDHPVFDYELFAVSSGGAPALVVTRTFDVRGIRIVFVADILGADRAIPGALHFVEDFARKRQAALVDVTATGGALTGQLRRAGWFSTLDDRWFRVPHLFYPVQMKDPPTTSAAIWSRFTDSSICDVSRLHLMKSDIDMDRPTLAYYEQHGIPMR